MVGEFVAHDSSPQFGSLNHGSPAKRNAPGPLLVRRLRTGADINQSSISAKCVENDPERKSRPPPSRAAGHLMFEQRKLPPISSAVSCALLCEYAALLPWSRIENRAVDFAGCVSDEGEPRVIAALDLEFIF